MRVVIALLVVGLALASATSTLERLQEKVSGGESSFSSGSFGSLSLSSASIPATRLDSHSSHSSHSSSHSSHHDGCGSAAPPCSPHVSFNSGSGDGANSAGTVDDALKPVDDWIKDFKKRTSGAGKGGNELYRAAKAIVAPLLHKLHRQMKTAEEKLKDSNRAILTHVETATVDHVYKLLKADQDKQKADERKEEHVQKLMDMQAKQKEHEEHQRALLGISKKQAKALAHALKSTGVLPSESVVSHIAHLLSESSHSASHSMASALSHASHSSTHSEHGSHHKEHSGSHHEHSGSHHESSSHHSGSSSHHSGSSSHHSSSHF